MNELHTSDTNYAYTTQSNVNLQTKKKLKTAEKLKSELQIKNLQRKGIKNCLVEAFLLDEKGKQNFEQGPSLCLFLKV